MKDCCRNMFAGRCEVCGRIMLRDGTEYKRGDSNEIPL